MPINLLSLKIQVDRDVVERGTFYDFFRMTWPMIDPAPFVPNWHIVEKCKHLEALSNGEIRRLVINEPPGSGKSNTVNVLWNAWEWVKRPHSKFIYASFDFGLVGTRDGGKLIRLLESDWFVARWGRLLEHGKSATGMIETSAGGMRFATTPAGKGTGRHCDFRVVDDPSKPKDARGRAAVVGQQLRIVRDWWSDTMSSRAANSEMVRDVLIMQRIHREDLAGDWLRKNTPGLVHLRFPMLYDPSKPCHTKWGGDPRTVKDELMFPKRYSLETVDNTRKNEMTEDVFESQMQQNPTNKSGGMFKRDWWKFWHYKSDVPEPCLCDDCWALKRTIPGHGQTRLCMPLAQTGQQIQSWDCTFKKSTDSDYVSGGLFLSCFPYVYLVDRDNEKKSFTDTVRDIRLMSIKYPKAYVKLVEDKANGTAVEDVLRHEIPGITLVEPMGGKESRANAGSIYFSSGRFLVPHPEIHPWVWAFMDQHDQFPKGLNDDDVDMTSQLLIRLKQHGEAFSKAMARIRGEA